MTDRHPSRESGFTLMETLVALFVIAILAVSGATLLIQTLRAGQQVDTRMTELRDIQRVHALLRDDLSSITLRATATTTNLGEPAIFHTASASPDALMTFTRGGWQVLPGGDDRSDLQRVQYALEDGALVRTAWLRPDATSQTPAVRQPLIEGVARLEIRYLIGDLWVTEWQTGRMSAPIPRAIEMTLELAGQGEIKQIFLTGAAAA